MRRHPIIVIVVQKLGHSCYFLGLRFGDAVGQLLSLLLDNDYGGGGGAMSFDVVGRRGKLTLSDNSDEAERKKMVEH